MLSKKMKAAVIISGLRGIFYASLEIANRLQKEGYEVTICATKDIGNYKTEHDFTILKLPLESISHEHLKNPNYHQKFLAEIDNLDCDVYICDLEHPVYILACIALNKNTFILNHFLPIPLFADSPIPNTDVVPGKRLSGTSVFITSGWIYVRAKLFVRAILERIKMKFKDRRTLLLRLGENMGLKTSSFLLSRTFLPGPYILFSNVPLLHITAEELDFPHRLQSFESYVGPMIYLNRKDEIDVVDEARFESILRKVEKNNLKLIYVALSSKKAVNSNFMENLLDALSANSDWEVIVGLGNSSTVSGNRNMPKNIHLFQWVPGLKALAFADCAVIMAGFHTVHECIYHEVPMLAFSFKTTDQEGFLARIESKNLGLKGKIEGEHPEEIRKMITDLLNNPKYKDALREMRMCFEHYSDKKVLETIVKNYLSDPKDGSNK